MNAIDNTIATNEFKLPVAVRIPHADWLEI